MTFGPSHKNLNDGNTVSYQNYMKVKLGRQSELNTSILQGGIQRKATPAPVWGRTPATSSIIPHTSVMSRNEIDKSSYAFIAKRYSSTQKVATVTALTYSLRRAPATVIMNWNRNGLLNA